MYSLFAMLGGGRTARRAFVAVWLRAVCRRSCLFYVFYQPGDSRNRRGEDSPDLYLQERKEATYENLRDLNFEYKAGKLSDADYAVQRASLEDEAAAILAEMESIEKARAVLRHGTRRAGVRANGGRA